ncbi:PHD finger protein rhinoceros-like isoform X1 [Papaver somniferum]|uniref:PHD finger protein rhinoceros-like isoform X1 n=1 Tax=Papaver somniferum TaxID=3469 RepID=UPI000E6FAD16|nr:PHD finger protein rhinoceros-like isoform X1 [Papaver somniferum]
MAQLYRVETSSKSQRDRGSSTEQQQHLQHHPPRIATGHEHHPNEATARILATEVTPPAVKHPQNEAIARITTVATPTKHHQNEASGKTVTVVTPTTPTTPMFGKNHDQEEIDHITHSPSNKKSVIAKVKEKAKKWKHNLVNKKKHHNNSSPSASPGTATPTTPPPPAWGVALDDDDYNDAEEDDDKNHYHVEHKEAAVEPAEYLGAPMYQSERASNDPGKHSDKPAECLGAPMYGSERASNDQGKHSYKPAEYLGAPMYGSERASNDQGKHSHKPAEYLGAPMYGSERASNEQGKHSHKPAEYLGAPMYESERASNNQGNHLDKHVASHAVLQPLVSDKHILETKNTPILPVKTTAPPIVSMTTTPPPDNSAITIHVEKEPQSKKESPSKTITETVTEKFGPAYAKVSEATQSLASKIQNAAMPASSASSTLPITSSRDETRSGEKRWDKGVSVRQYFISKLEPGDEEKALSEVISDAMSPKTITGDTGVVEKVREAVSSMLGVEQASPTLPERIPVSTNPQEVFVEEKHERRLQAN